MFFLVGDPSPSKPVGSTFDTATALMLDAQGRASIEGSITSNKVDVYDLGPVQPGDRISAQVRPKSGSRLDPVIAVFDEGEELFALNDDVDLVGGRIDSAIDEVVHTASNRYYLAVTKYFSGDRTGAYEGEVSIQRGQPIPTPMPQTLLLNFSGGSIVIPGDDTYVFGPFNAADIDPAYAGDTSEIKSLITATVRENFEDTGLVIFTTDDPVQPTGDFSEIFFGAFSSTKFGVAQSVDQGNRDCCDDGIVFTNGFDKAFSPQPSTHGIGIAIGNVAAHEAGHLLGLNHVADVSALMDTTGSASTLLADQEFKTAPLSETIFPFGKQNDMAILNRVVPQ